ncbi:MAG: prepilin-type N-terminal cleavage/methylation domain-containing protein [bacterium]
MQYNKSKSGFTMIELLVVIVIIGILATFAGVMVQSARGKARDSKRISDIRNMRAALEMYKNDEGNYPTDGEMNTPGDALTSPSGITYIYKIPSNPTQADGICTGAQYTYNQDESGVSYHINYCLGDKVASLPSGNCIATPGGMCDVCVPSCGGCGTDGCGGSCPDTCEPTESCYNGVCGNCENNNDCGLCKKCVSNNCINQGSSEDLKEECDTINCNTGNCNGSGACGYYTSGKHNCSNCKECNGSGQCIDCSVCCKSNNECGNTLSTDAVYWLPLDGQDIKCQIGCVDIFWINECKNCLGDQEWEIINQYSTEVDYCGTAGNWRISNCEKCTD